MNKHQLFTFVDDCEGDTSISQSGGDSIEASIRAWLDARPDGPPPRVRTQIDPVPVNGVQSVWCWTYLDGQDRLHILHIICTYSTVAQ